MLDRWHNQRLIYINNRENSLTSGSDEQLNAENIFYIYSDFILPGGESINTGAKDDEFPSMCEFPEQVSSCQSGPVCLIVAVNVPVCFS